MDDPDTAQPRPRNAAVINDYRQLCAELRAQHRGQTIVCTIGSWDILHEGHVAYLKEAREQGDVLVVGVDSDEAYKFYKKESAFYPEVDRQAIVAALRYVDYVTIVCDVNAEGEWGMDLVRTIEPDVFVCNNNTYSPEQRTRLADLSGAVRSLPFHYSPRSVDASVNLKRAGRMSHSLMSLIPTKRQWRRWSTPSKLTAVGVCVSILSLLLAVIVLLPPWSFQATTPSAEQLDCSSPTVKTREFRVCSGLTTSSGVGMRQFRDARSRAVSAHPRNRGSLAGGLGGLKAGGRRGPRSSGAPGPDGLGVSGMRRLLQTPRPSARAAVATLGYLPISYDPARRAAPQRLPRARSARGEIALGGAVQPLHGVV